MTATLASLQRDFQAYVLGKRQGVVKAVEAESTDEAIARLDVYARAYESRLLEILRLDFPALRVLTGEAAFDALGRAYIRAHPSDTPNARWFGRHLPVFLARGTESCPHPAMAEMARFEWALGLAFDAPDEQPLSLERLASVPATRLAGASFRLHPSVQRVELLWNVPAFWTAVESSLTPPVLEAALERASWAVWRPELTSRFRALEPDEREALEALGGGKSFTDICEVMAQRIEPADVARRAAQLIRRWVEEGLLGDVVPAEP